LLFFLFFFVFFFFFAFGIFFVFARQRELFWGGFFRRPTTPKRGIPALHHPRSANIFSRLRAKLDLSRK